MSIFGRIWVRECLCQFLQDSNPKFLFGGYGASIDHDAGLWNTWMSIFVWDRPGCSRGIRGTQHTMFVAMSDGWFHAKVAQRGITERTGDLQFIEEWTSQTRVNIFLLLFLLDVRSKSLLDLRRLRWIISPTYALPQYVCLVRFLGMDCSRTKVAPPLMPCTYYATSLQEVFGGKW